MKTLFLSLLFFSCWGVSAVHAQTLQEKINAQMTAGAEKAELGIAIDPRIVLAQVVQLFLGFLAIIFLFLILRSGYDLVIARGDSKKEDDAKDRIRRAIIGFTLVILAYSVTIIVSRVVIGSVAGFTN